MASGNERPALSIVIPLYNEAESLDALADRVFGAIKRFELDAEVLFVDDGSSDGSEKIFRRLCDVHPRLRVIRLRRNFGQTAAMAAGFDHARGAVIVVLDGDLQNDPEGRVDDHRRREDHPHVPGQACESSPQEGQADDRERLKDHMRHPEGVDGSVNHNPQERDEQDEAPPEQVQG